MIAFLDQTFKKQIALGLRRKKVSWRWSNVLFSYELEDIDLFKISYWKVFEKKLGEVIFIKFAWTVECGKLASLGEKMWRK